MFQKVFGLSNKWLDFVGNPIHSWDKWIICDRKRTIAL